MQNNLGKAYAILAQLSGDAKWFDQAAAAFQLSLDVTSRESEPVSWAMSQVNLGHVLLLRGRKDNGTG